MRDKPCSFFVLSVFELEPSFSWLGTGVNILAGSTSEAIT